jgi:hypothetical protein
VSRSQRVKFRVHRPNVALLLLEVGSELLLGDALSELKTLGDLVKGVALLLLIQLGVLLQKLVFLDLSFSNIESIRAEESADLLLKLSELRSVKCLSQALGREEHQGLVEVLV